MNTVRTRIAPSPTGFPHIGTLFQGLINYAFAQHHQGQFIVRIEDTDQARQVTGSEEAIFQALEWGEIIPDESPIHGGDFGPYRQSERLDIYHKYAHQLVDQGDAYYCFCYKERLETVRKNMQAAGKPPMYDRHCRDLDPIQARTKSKQQVHVIRMKIPDGETLTVKDLIRGDITFQSDVVDDQIILKSDGFPTYHLGVVVDDHLMKITHTVRGEEWISSAPKHLLLFRYFGWDMPQLIHTPLLRNPDKSKLGKRHGHASVTWYQEQGYLIEAVRNFLITRVWNHPSGEEIFDLPDIIKHFELKDMHIQGPIVDLDKLNWLNGQWIRRLPQADILKRAEAFKPQGITTAQLKQIWPLISERIEHLSQLTDLIDYFATPPAVDQKAILKEAKQTASDTANYLKQVKQVISDTSPWTVETVDKNLHQLQAKVGWKPRPAFMTIRLAVTGRSATPPLFDTLHLIGQTESKNRLAQVISQLE